MVKVKLAGDTVYSVPRDLLPAARRIDPIRHAAAAAWERCANEDIRPMNSISERNGGSGDKKKISLRVTIKLPSAA